jgi:hypothetical protein
MNPAYLPTTTLGILGRVIEETGEVLQFIGKALRFGLFNKHPRGDETNLDGILRETQDLEDSLMRARVALLERKIHRDFRATLEEKLSPVPNQHPAIEWTRENREGETFEDATHAPLPPPTSELWKLPER